MTRRVSRRARAFTMLEIMLASVIGALVILASIALFNSMDRMDRALARRADDTTELARLHLVMSRTFSTLIMTDQPVPRNPIAAEAAGAGATTPAPSSGSPSPSGSGSTSGRTTTAGATTGSTTSSSTTTGSTTTGQSSTSTRGSSTTAPSSTTSAADALGNSASQTKTPLPRFLLAASSTALAPSSGTSPAQRLEVVITKPPITDPRAPGLSNLITQTITVEGPPLPASKTTSDPASTAFKSASPTATDSGAPSTSTDPADQSATQRAESRTIQTTGEAAGVRGFFELIPESALPGYTPPRNPQTPADAKQPLALIWRQLPIASEAATTPAPILPEPIVVARGLEAVRWKAFHERERKDLFAATWANDLPAYVEMEVRTTSGQYANWMFEVDWSVGPEPGEPPAVATRGPGAGARGGGPGGGGPGGAGGGRGPGVGNGQGRALRVPGATAGRAAAGQPLEMRDQPRPPGERRRRDGQRREFNPNFTPRDFNQREFNPRDLPPPPPPSGQPARPARSRPAQTTGGPR
ncbi:MAG: hypothetical protein IT436_12495 [Phycisphaerales bacterium]|nr:hypothetical protein [Phycisphaerales bacterium]